MSKYTCPLCNQGFDKAKKSNTCPICQGHIIYRRKRVKGGGFEQWWEVGTPNSGKDIEPQIVEEIIPEEPKSRFPLRVSEDGQNPVVIQASENEYDVYYVNIYYSGMVYCPACHKPAFQNMTLRGSMEHLCLERIIDKGTCKAKTTYHFNESMEAFY